MIAKFFFSLCLLFQGIFIWGESKTVLVTGGAGYIGTQTCKALKEAGFFPVVYDNLVNGHAEAVHWGVLEVGDIADRKRLSETIEKYHPIAAIHFAAYKAVGESVKDPAKYYLNNVCGSVALLDVLREKNVKKIIFSSTASLYGNTTGEALLKESDPSQPINPYATTKWMVEKILADFQQAYGLEYVALRYFNVAGADLKKECGELGTIPHNLVPIVLQVAADKRKELEVFGQDYPSKDGTPIRDYIHVVDLADAHVKALQYLLEGKPSVVLNLGTGQGATVRDVVDAARKVTKRPIPVKDVPRRFGDPFFLVADASLANELLKWKPKHSDLETIIESEWKWLLQLDSQR